MELFFARVFHTEIFIPFHVPKWTLLLILADLFCYILIYIFYIIDKFIEISAPDRSINKPTTSDTRTQNYTTLYYCPSILSTKIFHIYPSTWKFQKYQEEIFQNDIHVLKIFVRYWNELNIFVNYSCTENRVTNSYYFKTLSGFFM